MTDLDRGINPQGLPAIGAVFSCRHAPEIGVGGRLEVFSGCDVLQVVILFVGAADQVLPPSQGFIHEQNHTVSEVSILSGCDIF